MVDDKLNDEEGRLAALRRYEILDTPREEPFEKITRLVQTVLNVPFATVSLIDADRQWYKSCVGMDGADLPRSQSFCTHTIQSHEPLLIPDTLEDPRFASYPTVVGPPHIRSYVGIPLATPDGYNLGSLCALDNKPRSFQPPQVAVLQSFAALVMDELELRRIAQFDSLTEAATRRSFLLELEKAIAATTRHRKSSLIALDVDHFKSVNDTYGHAVGDTVLRSVSQTALGMLRKGDVLGRLGGEEFGILLRDTDLPGAEYAAERLRNAIAALTFPAHPGLSITASFGTSELIESLLSPQAWLKSADDALYQAKQSGRNRCCTAKEQQFSLIGT